MNQKSFPGFVQSMVFLIGIMIFMILLSLVVRLVDLIFHSSLSVNPFVMGAINLICIAFFLAIATLFLGKNWKDSFPLSMPKGRLFLPATLAVLGSGILLSEFDNFFRFFVPMPEVYAQFFLDLLSGSQGFIGSFFLAVIIAPFTEEFLFRGFLLTGFLGRYSIPSAVILSSLLFAAFHINPWQFFGAFFIGILLAWFYVTTGSLILALYGHALNNFFSLFVVSQLNNLIPGLTTSPHTVEFQPFWLDMTGLALFVTGVYFYQKEVQQSKTGVVEKQRENNLQELSM